MAEPASPAEQILTNDLRPNRVAHAESPAETSRDSEGLSATGAQLTTPSPDAGGIAIPGYEMMEALGRGGMGVVYKARQVGLNRLVALKTLRSGQHASADELARFRNEAEVIARFQHPNLVQIFEVGSAGGCLFLALEFVDGGTLAQRLDGSPWPSTHAAKLIETLAGAVEYAHRQGVIHRDLKPANILLKRQPPRSPGGESPDSTADQALAGSTVVELPPAAVRGDSSSTVPKIADFGLAKDVDSQSGRTVTGAFMGTPSYAAPEQASGDNRHVSARTDVYALGAILYQLLTGRPPFRGTNLLETLEQVRLQEPVPPRHLNPKTPGDLETICLKCLRKPAADRYQTARALADDLRRFQAGQPILARPVGWAERAMKWARRHPAKAALVGVSLLALAAVSAAAASVSYQASLKSLNAQLTTAVETADSAKTEAETARNEADRLRVLANRVQYDSDLSNAGVAWREGKIPRLLSLLDQHHPKEAGRDLRGFEWHYLRSLCHGEAVRLSPGEGFGGFSPDGQFLAVIGSEPDPAGDGKATRTTVRLRDAATLKAVRSLRSHGEFIVVHATFLDGGKSFACMDMDNVARVWDVATGEMKTIREEQKGYVNTAVLSPDGQYVACALGRNEVLIWDQRTGKPVHSMPKTYTQPTTGIFRPDGKQLFWGNSVQTDVWDLVTGQRLRTIVAAPSFVLARAFTPDGKQFVVSHEDGTVRFYDPDTGVSTGGFRAHPAAVSCVAFSPDGKRLATAGDDNRIVIWDAATRTAVREFKGHGGTGAPRTIQSLTFHPDNVRLASTGLDGTARVWDTTRDQECLTLTPPADSGTLIYGAAHAPGGRTVVSGRTDGTLTLFDGKQSTQWKAHGGDGSVIAFRPDGARFATSGRTETPDPAAGDQSRIRVWDVTTRRAVLDIKVNDRVNDMAYSPDGHRLVTTGFNGITVWNAATGERLRTVAVEKQSAFGVAFHPHDPTIAVGTFAGLHVIDVNTGVVLHKGESLGFMKRLAYSPDGALLAHTGLDGAVTVLDGKSAAKRFTLDGHVGSVNAVAFTPDGSRLVSGGEDKTVRLWDLVTGRETAMLLGHAEAVWSVSVSSDGRRLATGDKTAVKIWDATKSYEMEK